MEPFTNEDRRRYYGLRIGDTVKLKYSSGEKEETAEVTGYAAGDNNRVYVTTESGEETDWIAEWCDIMIRVEDKE